MSIGSAYPLASAPFDDFLEPLGSSSPKGPLRTMRPCFDRGADLARRLEEKVPHREKAYLLPRCRPAQGPRSFAAHFILILVQHERCLALRIWFRNSTTA